MATSDLISYFTWFKQLVELRGRTLVRAVAFFKDVKKVTLLWYLLLCSQVVRTYVCGRFSVSIVRMSAAGIHLYGSHFDDVTW